MISRLVFLLFCGPFLQILGNAEKLPRVKRQNLKVQINATGDAVCMSYVRPSPSTELEGFILGYGSSFFSNQYFSLPSDGETYITEVDAEPRYLIAVRPAPVPNYKKPCSGKTKKPKPLQLVIGTLTPTSVFLSWGILVNPSHDWTTMNSCANDRFYTVRYREKDKNKKWVLQLCPTTETVVDNLKPNAIYEFGVKDNIDNGIWSKIFTHKVAIPGKNKENGQLQNSYKLPKIQAQFMPDSKTLIPVKVIKQVLQNITHRTQSKIPGKSPLSGPILVHLIVPDINGTQQKLPLPLPSKLDIFEKSKKIIAMNKTQKWLAESKTLEVQEITPQSPPALTEHGWESNKPTAPSVSEESVNLQAHTENELESSKPSITSVSELPLVTLALHKFPILPKSRPSSVPQMSTEQLASSEIQQDTSKPQTPVPKTIQTKPVFSKPQPAFSSPQTSDEIAMSDIKPAITNEPTLASLTSKTSKPLDSPRATLAPSETSFIPFTWKPSDTLEGWHGKPVSSLPTLKQNTPKISRIAEKLKASPAGEKESQQKTTIPSIYKTPELPRTTMAFTSKLVPVPATTKISATAGHPVATMASYGPTPILSQSKETFYTVPEVPSRKPVTTEADNFSPKLPTTSEFPFTNPASYGPSPVPSKYKEPAYTVPEISDRKPVLLRADSFSPKLSTTPELPVAKPVSTDADSFSPRPKLSTTPELPFTKPATYESRPVPSKRKEPVYTIPDDTYRKPVSTDADNFSPKLSTAPELPVTKPESYEPSPFPPKSKEPVYIMPEVPDRKPVSTEADNFFPKLSTTSEFPFTKIVLEPITFSNELPIVDVKDKHHLSIPKTTVSPYVLHPKSDPKETHSIPTKSKTPLRPGTKPTKPSLKVNHDVSSKPKTSLSPKVHPSRPAPKETQRLPSKPKPSDKQEVSQTKPASSKTHYTVTTTENPHMKTVMHKTPAPGRSRTPGEVAWSKIPRGDKVTNEDPTKLLSTSSSTKSSISLETATTRRKTEAVATPPGSPRPPLAPARPTPIRRKPLPPNTVTGKPGRSGNALMPRGSSFSTTSSVAKPTWPSSIVKTTLAKKPPTASASPDYSNPMFSSLPTSETDISGTPRYTGDHVKYLQKEDDIPCSITDTLQHFPTEEGENMDMATTAPQKPPTNLTVVTVEGCPSFIILDWQKPENETVTEYKVVSTENGGINGNDKSVITTNQTHSTVENLKPNTSYEFVVIPSNPLGEGPSSEPKPFRTESADPRVTESISMGKDAIWTEVKFNSDDYSECKGKQYVKRTWYKKFVGVQLCNSLRYKIYLSDSLSGTFYNIGDQNGHGEDHCQFVDSYLDGRTGQMLPPDQLPTKEGYFRAVRQEPVNFGKIGAATHITYVHWYECGTTIPGKW